jgi:hypothetical protein
MTHFSMKTLSLPASGHLSPATFPYLPANIFPPQTFPTSQRTSFPRLSNQESTTISGLVKFLYKYVSYVILWGGMFAVFQFPTTNNGASLNKL